MPSNIEGSRLRYGYDKAKGTDRSCLTVWKNQECLFLLWDNQADAFMELIQSAEERGMRRVIDKLKIVDNGEKTYTHGWEYSDGVKDCISAAESLIPKE